MKMICEFFDAAGEIRRERQPLLGTIAADNFFEARLVDGYLAALQGPYLRRVFVYAHHVVAVFGKARAGHQPNVSTPDDRYLQLLTPNF